jgi:hypothetical protein
MHADDISLMYCQLPKVVRMPIIDDDTNLIIVDEEREDTVAV